MGAKPGKQSERGFTLLSAVMGSLMAALSLMAFNMAFRAHLAEISRLQNRNALEDMRRLVRLSTDCTKTTKSLPSTCTKEFITVLDFSGSPFVASMAPWKSIGNYTLRAKCRGNSHKTIDFYVKDKKGNEKPLFPENIPFTCGAP